MWLVALGSLLMTGVAQPPEPVSPLPDEPVVIEKVQNSLLKDWFPDLIFDRPEGPVKVGIQVGHWRRDELPEELEHIKENTGAQVGDVREVDTNLAIAQQLVGMLEEKGYEVDLLPTAIPPYYRADVFVTVHGDGSLDQAKSGYKVAGPYRDFNGKNERLVEFLNEEYGKVTGLPEDPEITDNMRGYYAFNWWRYSNAVHPLTPAAIVETAFLTNEADREFLVNQTELIAQGIAQGIVRFVEEVVEDAN